MVKDNLKKMLEEKHVLEFEHFLVFRFFEKHSSNQLVVSSLEVHHMGKQLRLFNSYAELQNIFKLQKNNVYLKLDAVSKLYDFFESKGYIKTTKKHNNWAEYSVTIKKKIDIESLVDEIYTCFNYYYQLCLDHNIPIHDFLED